MDVERAVLKAGVTLAALFAVYQGTQGMQEFAKQRSEKASQEAQALQIEREKKERTEGYIESLRVKEAERRRSEAASFNPGETSQDKPNPNAG
ncbi:hypothetical protein BBI09_05070 [Stutzerimonas xanthomarina]|uniref:hypothetical protein n=1 Tax=Stutzerimonas nitrititolerans TaxID=2482751 RepID=UPI000824A532|nr:hypothetical protein [Stutzerimonas nitrititolerans]OCX21741.1 hypothetical protein BBI09_05070 [Stutzerimonas xanthomarina]HBB78392.1 hypothetical protein [Pseudomonas sp.]